MATNSVRVKDEKPLETASLTVFPDSKYHERLWQKDPNETRDNLARLVPYSEIHRLCSITMKSVKHSLLLNPEETAWIRRIK